MEIPKDQIDELKKICPEVQMAEEGGYTFFFLPQMQLPIGCSPEKVDLLYCPTNRDGYPSRLFFSSKIIGSYPNRNWNGNARILDRTWYAISWKINQEQRLVQQIRAHLEPLKS